MKITEVRIHNYRTISDQTFVLSAYSLLIGANNSGKSNVIDALRTFYEKDIKFEYDRDFPKFETSDKESWVEIEYELSGDEKSTIKEEYLIRLNNFRVRKWLYPSEKAKAGLYGYEGGKLSENLFYGWKNVSQGKLGNVIYIPAVSRLEEHTKLTGPSALKELIDNILKPIITSSSAFIKLKKDFEHFSNTIKSEETADGRSLSGLESKISGELENWGAQFNLDVTGPKEDLIVKNLIRHTITDDYLKQEMEPEAFGHGFQRHLIFSIIRISANYTTQKPEPKKKEFSPNLELILFEEPEVFLHPPQQDVLDTSLRQITATPGRQILAASHSPLFVSCNTDDISDLIVLHKMNGRTEIGHISRERLNEIFLSNQAINEILKDSKGSNDSEDKVDLEAVRHFLWLNPERCGLFFANRVLIVEGLAEQVLINNLVKEGKVSTDGTGVFVLETLGKYNIHRFMNLLGEMKIKHAVLYDDDCKKSGKEKESHEAINRLIQDSANKYTLAIDSLSDKLESLLGISVPKEDMRWKASYILLAYKRGDIAKDKLGVFIEKIQRLLKPKADTETVH